MITLTSRSDWQQFRQLRIGASDAAAILGVSNWKSPLQLFYEKRGMEPPNKGEEFARRLGLKLERPIAELYAQETGRKVKLPDAGEFWVAEHPSKPFMVATLDGQTYSPSAPAEIPLEIKTAAISKAASWVDEPPIDYQVQVQHQMAVTNTDEAVCVALIGGVSLKYSELKRDPEFAAMLEAACEEFIRRVELNDPPPADGTEATKDFLKRLYGTVAPTSATLPPEAIEWDRQRIAADLEIKRHNALKLEAENRLKQAIGENIQGLLPNGVVYTWKPTKRRGYSVAETTYRDFRRHGTKEEKLAGTLAKTRAPKLDIETVQEQFQEEQGFEDVQFD